ncbi:imidazole glycerol phosphate synthase subunit HisH [Caminicella sporogenes]|uniref:imidazole glycerol phosphate synthase subunit HisH n=1 Tax=Caminicella sporogenes TaxID=166485 RepID=UPI00253F6F74|nr:imidazole glycerol phosphate synthase subunit HisH [Caminicella sporogenes]WIF95504.1 imidazole glycerol phosphate synthase subunit HisH [Caminicella sporogenes]
MIVIVDYGVGNVKNVYNYFSKIGRKVIITDRKKYIDNCSLIVLPGVGAFKDAMDNLRKKDLISVIKDNAKKGKLLIGICLGMQLLYERSYEDGIWEGLGLLEGEIIKFKGELKVPHMGWNSLTKNKQDIIAEDIETGEYVYFVHSYYLKSKNNKEVIFKTNYGVDVPAVIRRNNIIGMQFHPEKSGKTGEKFLKNIKELIG